MESSAATAAHEGRYTALHATAHTLSSEELLDVIELAQREKDAAAARQAVALAHLSAREPHLQEDGTHIEVHHGIGHQRLDGPELVAPRLGVSTHVASNRILTAIRQLTRTPAVIDAMASGDLDEYRASVVTDETEYLPPESAAEVVNRVKDHWAGLTPGPLRRFVARTAAQVDPDAVAKEAEDERARRGLTRRTGVHGTDHWRGDFLVERSRPAWAAVTERARQLVRDGDADTLEQARADAMMELILEHCDIKVVVHTTHGATDDTPDSETPGATHDTNSETPGATAHDIDSESAGVAAAKGTAGELVEVGGLGTPGTTFVPRGWLERALSSQPTVTGDRDLTCHRDTGALLHGDVPEALARGQHAARRAHQAAQRSGKSLTDFTHSYRVPDGMARLVRLRDGSCRFPGCATPARQCDLDHVRPWPDGPTTPTNLIALCRRHHRIKQRDGWSVTLHPDATLTWTDPTGRATTTRPVDHLHLITTTRPGPDTPDTMDDTPGASGTHGTHGTQPTSLADILTRLHTHPTTFEDALHDLLDTHTHDFTPRPTRPHTLDNRGRLISGPLPTIDLETGHGPPHPDRSSITVTIDHPPPPPDPDTIPF